jgi:hypothetical protein
MKDRHQCEVRHVLALRAESREKVDSFLALVEARRGREAANRLKADAAEQWSLGNRGKYGDWRKH